MPKNISYLWPYRATAYAHISVDLGITKFSLRFTKVTLLKYFGREGYKLLNWKTYTIYKSQNVIFKKEVTHIASQPILSMFNDKDDFFKYRPKNKPIAKELLMSMTAITLRV